VRTVFLDRDGVLNRAVVRGGKPYPPASPGELEILPGVPDALARLRAAGCRLVVVTNQPDVARGTVTRAAVDATNAMLRDRLGLDDIRVCPHDDGDNCECRKPRPGLLLQDAFDRPTSVMIGDRWRDIEAGRAAGVGTTILVDYDYDEPMPHEPDVRVASLAEAADWILERAAPSGGEVRE
jgi:D-glycero-D-manno-heptose 1,7-bisphosphate phosphatase